MIGRVDRVLPPLRSDTVMVEQVAAVLLVLTSFTMPMNQLFVGPLPVSDLLMLAALGMYGLSRLTDGRPVGINSFRPLLLALGLLAAGGFVGALFEAPGPFYYQALGEPVRDVSGFGPNIANLLKFVLGSFLPIGLWVLARPRGILLKQVMVAFTAGAALSVLVGYALPMGRVGSRLVGLTVHPGQLGSISLLAMGPAIGLLLSGRGFRPWHLGVLPVLAFGVLGSGSRAALGALALLAVLIFPLTRSRAVAGTLLVCAAVITVAFAFGFIEPKGENALGRLFGDAATSAGSNAIRADLGDAVLDRWEQRPITGNGYNLMRPSHNVYLGILGSAGILGVAGFGTLVATIIRRLMRSRANVVAVAVTASYLAYLGAAYFDNIFWWRWLWFYVGMVMAALSFDRVSSDPGEVPDDPDDRDGPVPVAAPQP